jgi:hypothetical protein
MGILKFAGYALLLDLVESVVLFVALCIAHKLEFPNRGFMSPDSPGIVDSHSTLFQIWMASYMIFMTRIILFNIPVNFIAQYVVNKVTSGLNLRISLAINVGIAYTWAALILIFLPNDWVNPHTPIEHQALTYGTALGCLLSPVVLFYLGLVPYKETGATKSIILKIAGGLFTLIPLYILVRLGYAFALRN